MRLVVPALLLFFGSACSEPPPVSSVYADSTLVSLISDLHLHEARWSLGDTSTTRTAILQKHGFTELEYREILTSLIDDPDRFVSVYDSVIHRLTNQPVQ